MIFHLLVVEAAEPLVMVKTPAGEVVCAASKYTLERISQGFTSTINLRQESLLCCPSLMPQMGGANASTFVVVGFET